MWRSIALSLGSAFAFYLIAAFVGGWLVMQLSSNRHDRQVEAAMTGAFVFGPVAAIVAFIVTFLILRPK